MSANFDHVIAAAVKHEAAGIVELGEVPGTAPPFPRTLDKSKIAFRGVTPIPKSDCGPRDQQLPSPAASVYRRAGIVDEQDPRAIARHPDRDRSNAIPVFPVNALECAHISFRGTIKVGELHTGQKIEQPG